MMMMMDYFFNNNTKIHLVDHSATMIGGISSSLSLKKKIT
jgi:hypothetical protein